MVLKAIQNGPSGTQSSKKKRSCNNYNGPLDRRIDRQSETVLGRPLPVQEQNNADLLLE
jgi:hypothetical protein